MPVSRMSMATTNSRVFFSIELHDAQSTIGMRNVVKSTSQSEMPSTASLKCTPNAPTHSLSTTWFHFAGSKSPSMNSDTPNVKSENAKANPRNKPASSRGKSRQSSAPNSGNSVMI